MPYEITEIKQIRKKLGLTQSDLAKRAGISQSLIAKVESGLLDPSYSNAKKIFGALDSAGKKTELKAEQIMQARIISVGSGDSAKDAIAKMKKYEISQLPVVDEGKVVGLISESILLDAIINNRKGAIGEIMNDAPPVISKDTSAGVVSELLRHYPLVVVGEKGRLRGIITKSDFLRKVYNK